ncbi:MAG: FHA domain-containing protein, partial [Agathobacter sp.]|nr:FHA domain-containing protein [Agathobacter sp.]
MINREVIYERNMTGSYMKIPEGVTGGLDERLMLKGKLKGTLPVEKAYIDGGGQYWYNISGKQSLDTYCRMKQIGNEFVERLIVSICSELEILEWNLIHTSCLMLDPELVFITNSNREFIFTLYPGNNTQIELEFQQLMEYLLTRIDHKDEAAVRKVYEIYEKTLEEGYSLTDIRDLITETRSRESGRPEEEHRPPIRPEIRPQTRTESRERELQAEQRTIRTESRERESEKKADLRGSILRRIQP